MTQVRLFAAAADAAGTATQEVVSGTLRALISDLRERHGEQFAAVLERCSILVDGRAITDPSEPLTGAQVIDILPPFAGG